MTSETAGKDQIRDAATVILVRRDAAAPRVLMGQRSAGAVFMPSKFVFPGGAVDAEDSAVPDIALAPRLDIRLRQRCDPALAPGLAAAAVRELWEEAGQILGTTTDRPMPAGLTGTWAGFFATGHRPHAEPLDFVFRAITPPGRPRRFDARFFLVEAEHLASDPDDFNGADAELSHLHWLTLDEARRLDLPFITEVVLAEIVQRLAEADPNRPVPFFHHEGGRSFIDGL